MWVSKEMTFSDGSFLEIEHHQSDLILALSEAVLACVNVGVTVIAEGEKGFL